MRKISISQVNIAISLTLMVAAMMVSCEKSEGEPVYLGHDYFGYTPGKYLIYQVDSIFYDDFLGEVFQFSYQVKEVNREIFIDAQGLERMRLERFYRPNDTHSWQIKNVWTAYLEKSRATKTEENITYVKLIFPLKRNATWNGNLYNPKPEQNFRIISIHESFELANNIYDSTVTVLQRDFTTLIGQDYQYEVYANGVGMIRKKFVSLDKEIDGTIIRGVDYSYSLLEYGFE